MIASRLSVESVPVGMPELKEQKHRRKQPQQQQHTASLKRLDK